MIEVRNFTRSFQKEALIKKRVEKVLKGENKKNSAVSIVIVGEKRIRDINKKYRKKDKPTDVLSFPFNESFIIEKELGEVFVCPTWIKKKKENLERVVIHGILHLLGYDHKKDKEEKDMRKKEDFYLL